MKGEPRLRRVEITLKIANASLPILEHLENPHSRFVRESVEKLGCAGGVVGDFHVLQSINKF
jgi:hypothetical protein